jgi:kynureninase
MIFEDSKRQTAIELDEKDPLASYRNKFIIDDDKTIYLDGNSLGRLPKKTVTYLQHVISQEWGSRLIRNWNEGWYEQSTNIGKKIAQLVGAQPDEVILSDSTSINLYKLAFAAIRYQPDRAKIVSDDFNFPSDLYILQSIIRQMGSGHRLELIKSSNGISIDMPDVDKLVDNQTSLLTLSHVAFKSAFMYDMARITSLAHSKGALMLWDLSHSVGVVPIHLNDCDVDLAIGCTYKYLNGGPGAPAFLYVRKDLQEKLSSPVWGWFGDESPFKFHPEYHASHSIKRFLIGTPPILSLSAIEPALDILLSVGIEKIRQKSILQTEYLLFLLGHILEPLGFFTGSPITTESRGSHITIRHSQAYRICQALIHPDYGDFIVIPDFREPDNIRLGIAPLYTSFIEIYDAVQSLKNIVEEKLFEFFDQSRQSVT